MKMGPWRNSVLFPALDTARQIRRVPLIYQALPRRYVTEIIIDGFFIPATIADRLSSLYAQYVEWWRLPTTPERRWFPKHGVGLSLFEDFVHLVVIREHADWWVNILNEAAPLTYNRWDLGMNRAPA